MLNNYDIMFDEIIHQIIKEEEVKNQRTWEIPLYSKSQINKAGKIIADITTTKEEKKKALEILNNWRASHAFPLQVICDNLRKHNKNAIVVQRLKRLESIIGKIERFPTMQLYKMQDLGGCRVIVDTIDQVYEAVDNFKKSRIRHVFKRKYNYIENPKESGYRSYHMVYQYHSDRNETYNKNMLIEIQFRTQLQHTWATAVEIMGIYTKSALKASQGDNEILRFFTLVSSLFALKEKTPTCPNTSDKIQDLLSEIDLLNKKHHILSILKAFNVTIKHKEASKEKKDYYYVMVLNYVRSCVNIHKFDKSEINIATKAYDELEKRATEGENVVLVSASSFDALRIAYPNYFADIRKFIEELSKFNIG